MPGFVLRSLTVAALTLTGAVYGADAYAERQPRAPQIRSAADVRCQVPKAPIIQVLPKAAKIRYDFSKTSQQLTAQGSNTVNPYAASVDSSTGGLRADQPQMSSNIRMGTQTYPDLKVGCLWYDSVVVNITMNPVIYIAQEYQQDPCKAAIMEHELKHVGVDREVMNRYATEIGKAIQAAVNQAGAMGPFNVDEMNAYQDRYIAHVQSAIDSKQLLLTKDMRNRQAMIDTREEYDRVSKICRDVIKKKR